MNETLLTIYEWLMRIPIVLLALTVHEVSHGYVAYKLGDPTAKAMGRLSLNPVRHLDPIGAICMLIAGFGWAKPVPINTRYFKNQKAGMALSALAGPVSNFLLGFVGLIAFNLFAKYIAGQEVLYNFYLYMVNLSSGITLTGAVNIIKFLILIFIYSFFWLNICLGIFNLIPLPPLDGSRVLYVFLPQRLYFGVMQYERYIALGLMFLLITRVLDAPLNIMMSAVFSGMQWLIDLVPFISYLK